MILTTLISFLGGNAFRMIFGEITAYFDKKREHEQELERMRLQGDLDAAAHERNLAAIKQQADLGVKTIQVQGEIDLDKLAAEGFNTAVELTGKATGIRWVDAWNAVIRPGVATWSVCMITLDHFKYIVLSESGWAIVGAALGIYLADRSLLKRGK